MEFSQQPQIAFDKSVEGHNVFITCPCSAAK